jgi:hypothetical protein
VEKEATVDPKQANDDLLRQEEERQGIYRVEKIVNKKSKSGRERDPNDLFEVVWERYPGQNTWQRRCELWGARGAVAMFEYPERFINNEMSTAQERYYGAGSKQSFGKVN